MKKKAKRLRGSNTHGRGYRKSRTKSGSRGGVGLAGEKHHKKISKILKKKKEILARKVTCIRDIESKLDRYIKKGLIKVVLKKKMGLQTQKVYVFTKKFGEKYRKILSVGEPSAAYLVLPFIKVTLSKKTAFKTRLLHLPLKAKA